MAVLVLAEHDNSALKDATLNTVSAALKLADEVLFLGSVESRWKVHVVGSLDTIVLQCGGDIACFWTLCGILTASRQLKGEKYNGNRGDFPHSPKST